jgi:hypothetical protein
LAAAHQERQKGVSGKTLLGVYSTEAKATPLSAIGRDHAGHVPSRVELWVQLREQLATRILDGRIPADHKMWSQTELEDNSG